MAEAQLRIKPTVVGSATGALRRDASALANVDRQQRRAIASGVAGTRRLERGWNSAARAGQRMAGVAGNIASNVLSLRGLVVGLGAGAGSKTVFDLVIGSNAKLEQQRITFETMIGDVGKANKLMGMLRQNAATTPFAEDDVIEGSKRLLRLTQGNITENMRLLKIAETMAAVNPDKSVSDAVEAILDAETQEFERLKEFGIKLRKEDIKKIKKSGESMGVAAMRGVEAAVSKQTGGRDIVGRLSESFLGRASTIKDMVKNQLRDLGEGAFEESKNSLEAFGKALEEVLSDDEFRRDMDAMAGSFLDMAKGATAMAKEMPANIRSLKAFVRENETLLKLGGGALVANKLTGGALGRGLASGAGAGAKRLLLGKSGGGGAAGAIAEYGGATPVYVVNMGAGMGGGDGFMGRTSKVLGKASPLTTAGLLKSGGLAGAANAIGAGGALGLLAIPATVVAAFLTLEKATEGTASALRALEDEATRRERGPVVTDAMKARDAREGSAAQRANARRGLTGGFRSQIDRAILEQDQAGKRALVQQALGGAAGSLKGAKTKEQRANVLAALNEEIAGYGIQASAGRGGLKFAPRAGETDERLKARGDVFARELNSVTPQINVTVQATGDAARDGQLAGEAAHKAWMKSEEEAARYREKIGPG